MRLTKLGVRLGPASAIVLATVFLSGCPTSIKVKYAYDAGITFPELKTYQWTSVTDPYRPDPLLVPNVQFFADRELASKGFTRQADKAELLIWITYDFEYQKGFQIRTLTLSVARAADRKLIWQASADGRIKTDAASNQLEGIVQSMLSSFPPE